MTEINQETLIAAQHHNKDAFKKLYDFYSQFVWNVAFKLSAGHKEIAADISQESFVRIWRFLPRFGGDAAFSTWVYRIVYNTSMSLLSKQTAKRAMEQPLEMADAHAVNPENFELKGAALKMLKSLETFDRFLLVAKEIDGLSFEEISIITRKKEGALRTQLSRIKDRLRKEHAYEEE